MGRWRALKTPVYRDSPSIFILSSSLCISRAIKQTYRIPSSRFCSSSLNLTFAYLRRGSENAICPPVPHEKLLGKHSGGANGISELRFVCQPWGRPWQIWGEGAQTGGLQRMSTLGWNTCGAVSGNWYLFFQPCLVPGGVRFL